MPDNLESPRRAQPARIRQITMYLQRRIAKLDFCQFSGRHLQDLPYFGHGSICYQMNPGSPRSGGGIKPGASAPGRRSRNISVLEGRGAHRSRRIVSRAPSGRTRHPPAFLGLKPQASCPGRFAAKQSFGRDNAVFCRNMRGNFCTPARIVVFQNSAEIRFLWCFYGYSASNIGKSRA